MTWLQKCYAVALYDSPKAKIAEKLEESKTMALRAFGPRTTELRMMGATYDGSNDSAADDGHCQRWALGTMGVAHDGGVGDGASDDERHG